MLDARTGRTRVTTAALPRATRHGAGAGREPRSTAEPCPLWSTESSVINILPLKTQVKYWRTSPPAGDHPFKLEVTFCVRGVISPLLSNLYMRRFVLGWKKLGHEKRLAAYIVNYADDLVICCRGRAEEALARMRDIMTKLKLTVNETKMRICKLPVEKFDFLGYTFGRCYSPKTGRAYIGTVRSKKRVIRVCEAISETTGRDQTLLDQEIVVAKLNRTMIGWANYFCLGPVSNAYSAVENHACKRLRQWLCAKHKVMSGTQRFSRASLHNVLGLVRLSRRPRHLPWATS